MSDQNLLEEDSIPTSYSSSTPAAATNRPAVKAPGAGTGRRKEAVARVRLTPGSGRWIVNNKNLEVYFPNKVHNRQYQSHFAPLALRANMMLLPALMVAEFQDKPERFA